MRPLLHGGWFSTCPVVPGAQAGWIFGVHLLLNPCQVLMATNPQITFPRCWCLECQTGLSSSRCVFQTQQMDFYISSYFMFRQSDHHTETAASMLPSCFCEINSVKLIGTRLKRKLKCSWVNRPFKHLFSCSIQTWILRWSQASWEVIYERQTLRSHRLRMRRPAQAPQSGATEER